MGRSPCCSKEGLNRGAWTADEDRILTEYIRVHGEGRWRNLPKRSGLKRCGKSCRLRWLNYLRPDIKRGNISQDEEELIIRLHKLLGNRWSLIAGRLPGRTDNEIKNYWNTNLGKKVKDNHKTSNSSRKLPSQPSEKSSKNPKTPSNTASPAAPSVLDPHVVRTKATRCSKVFINTLPHPQQDSMQFQNKSNAEAEAEPLHEGDAANHYINSSSNQTELNGYGFLSVPYYSTAGEDQELESDSLLVDFNMGELCLSDLLNSDFAANNMRDFSYNNNSDELSPSSEQPLVFSDEMLKDWTEANFAETNNNVADNLHSFSSLLESTEEWLGD